MTEFTGITARAEQWAADAFADWEPKFDGAEAPIDHLRRVARIISSFGGTDDQIAAGLLHDAIEDCGGHNVVPELQDKFGEAVPLVVACTDSWADTRTDPVTEKPYEKKDPWWDRKVPYIAHIAEAPTDALLVCAADKIDNVRRTHASFLAERDVAWSHFNKTSGRDGQIWYYRRVTEELERRAVTAGGAIAELRALVDAFVTDVRELSAGGDVDEAYAVWCEAERSRAVSPPASG